MYNFLFGFFYHRYKKQADSQPIFAASGVVVVAIGFHVLAVLSILKYLFNSSFKLYDGSFNQRIIGLTLLAPIIYLVYLFYKERSDRILDKYETIKSSKPILNNLRVVLILGVPLIICIVLGNINAGKW
jgi:hypothetical protein